MTMTTTTARASLRALARHLGCSHAALSKKVHTGLLTAGVALDARGRVVVTDFDAAAAEWSSIHVPSVAEMMRGSPAHAPAAPMPPPPDFFADLSKQDLLEAWAAFDLLANALIVSALGTESDQLADDAFIERTTALLRRIAPLRCADQETQVGAETLLRSLVADVVGELRAEMLGGSTR